MSSVSETEQRGVDIKARCASDCEAAQSIPSEHEDQSRHYEGESGFLQTAVTDAWVPSRQIRVGRYNSFHSNL